MSKHNTYNKNFLVRFGQSEIARGLVPPVACFTALEMKTKFGAKGTDIQKEADSHHYT